LFNFILIFDWCCHHHHPQKTEKPLLNGFRNLFVFLCLFREIATTKWAIKLIDIFRNSFSRNNKIAQYCFIFSLEGKKKVITIDSFSIGDCTSKQFLNNCCCRESIQVTFRRSHQHFTYEFFVWTSIWQLYSSYVSSYVFALAKNLYEKHERIMLMTLTASRT